MLRRATFFRRPQPSSAAMSFLARFWTAIRNPIRYVGRDLEGNRFYESRSLNDFSYSKRTVQYYDPEEVWQYIGGGKRLPIQWSAWLTHTRNNPPSIEELMADAERQRRVLANAARIEARDRAEAEEILRMRQNDAQLALSEASAQARGQNSVAEPIKLETDLIASEGSVSKTPSPAPAALPGNVLPPKFLTPSSPRKSRSSKPFSLPDLDAMGDPSISPPKAAPSPWITKPQETESWTPKAVKRG